MFSTWGVATRPSIGERNRVLSSSSWSLPDFRFPEVSLNPLHAGFAAIIRCQRTVHLQQGGLILGLGLGKHRASLPIRESRR